VPSFVVGHEVYFGNDRLPLLRHALLSLGGRAASAGLSRGPEPEWTGQ
jgi:hypothetical protein